MLWKDIATEIGKSATAVKHHYRTGPRQPSRVYPAIREYWPDYEAGMTVGQISKKWGIPKALAAQRIKIREQSYTRPRKSERSRIDSPMQYTGNESGEIRALSPALRQERAARIEKYRRMAEYGVPLGESWKSER